MEAGRVLLVAAVGALLSGQATPSAYELAGLFERSVPNGDTSGARFRTVDRVMIVAADRRNAYVSMDLSFFNGHQCSIDGMARMESSRLVLNSSEAQGFDGTPCRLEIWRDGQRLRWHDGNDTCRSNCGARGGFGDGEMRWSVRRAIRRAEQSRLLAEARRPRAP